MPTLRVWAEELEPENTLRLTWAWEDGEEGDEAAEREAVQDALKALEGVLTADFDDDGDGVIVEFDPEAVTRLELAAALRDALGASKPKLESVVEQVRVWAEDLSENQIRLTWEALDDGGEGTEPAARRKVAGWLAAQPGVKSARPNDEGVIITYKPEVLDRRALGDVVRQALSVDTELRERAEDLLRRAPTYGNLARKLALDERISPIPDAARQASSSRGAGVAGSAAQRTVLRMIPGAQLIIRLQTLLPVVQALAAWSREAPPDVVDSHLADAGLTREQLEYDVATAHEGRIFARDIASEKAADFASRAGSTARSAANAARSFIDSAREAASEPRPPKDEPDDQDRSGT